MIKLQQFSVLWILLLVFAACSTSNNTLEENSENSATATIAPSENPATATDPQSENTDESTVNSNTQSGDPVDTAEAKPEPEKATDVANVVNRPGKVANKGTYIRILVNNEPITNFDIQRRVEFLKLRRMGGDRSKIAEEELIDQVLKLQEAKRVKLRAGDKKVDEAFASFAKQNRATPSQLAGELGRLGVGAQHFKEFLRSQISWQQVVSGKFQAETAGVTQSEAVVKLKKSGEEKPQLAEYDLQQIIFVVPEAKRKQILKARKAEANAFRQRFTTCAQTLESVKALRDVSLQEKRRVLAPEIPGGWQEELLELSAGEISKPKETSKGVELFAVCELKMVNDDRAAQIATQSKEFDSFNAKGSQVSQEHLTIVRKRATIIYR